MKTLEQEVKNLEAVDVEALYDEMLDEAGPVKVAGLEFSPSHILKELDETAYRCGFNDFYDALSRDGEYEEFDEQLYRTSDVNALREEIESQEA